MNRREFYENLILCGHIKPIEIGCYDCHIEYLLKFTSHNEEYILMYLLLFGSHNKKRNRNETTIQHSSSDTTI